MIGNGLVDTNTDCQSTNQLINQSPVRFPPNHKHMRNQPNSMDPITLELYRHRFAGVAEEMGVTLRRTAYSPNIKERLDFSCAVFDGAGQMIAQAAHIPAHLGAMPASVLTILGRFPVWEPGDVVIVNDPFEGGNHLPDITMIAPVFTNTQRPAPDFFVASRAHHADVGGMTPGSLPLSTEIYQEGIIIPPVKLYKAGKLELDLLRLILRNVRTPDERRGDLAAQRAAAAVGERRLRELVDAHGYDEVSAYAEHLRAYSARLTRAAIRAWPDGVYTFEDVIELVEEGKLSLVPIRVTATIAGEEVTFDFTGTAPVMHGSLNAVIAIAQSACYYVVRCLVGDEDPHECRLFCPGVDHCTRKLRGQCPVAGRGGRRQRGNLTAHHRCRVGRFGASAARPDSGSQPGNHEQRYHRGTTGRRHALCLL